MADALKASIYACPTAAEVTALFNKTLDDFLYFCIDKFAASGIDVPKYRAQVNAANAVKPDMVIKAFGEGVLQYLPKLEQEDRAYFEAYDVSGVSGDARGDASMVVQFLKKINDKDVKFVFHYVRMLCYMADRHRQLAA